ncbi:MAG: WD40 repeat domain-containing protein [Wolinella sp.]
MLKVKRTIPIDGSVLSIASSGSCIVALDSTYHLTFIDPLSFDVIKNLSLSHHKNLAHHYSNGYSIAPQSYFCIPFIGTKKALILEADPSSVTKKAIIGRHDSDLECSAFSPDGRYLATGGQDGKVFIFEKETFRLLSSITPRAEYINNITFSSDSELIACSGFDKNTVLFDLSRNKTRGIFQTPDVVEKSLFFKDNQRLYLILRNGGSAIYDLLSGKVESLEFPFNFWPSALALSPDERFAIVGTRGDALYVMNLEENMRLLELKTQTPGIASLNFLSDHLFIGSIDGTILVIDYKEGERELEESLQKRDYYRARGIVESNAFLTIHPLMKIFDEDWDSMLKKASAGLSKERIGEAVKLVEPFIIDPRKRREFDFYLGQKDVVAQFATLIEQGDFARAYEMTLTTKFLTKTLAYTELESHWNRSFAQAKKLLEEDAELNLKKAEMVLKPFESSIKREVVAHLLKNSKIFTQADELIRDKNFKGYFSLANQFACLRDTELYKKVLILGEKMFENFLNLEKAGEYDEALGISKYLLLFPTLKRSVNERIILIQQKLAMLDAIKKHNIKQVYEIALEYEALRSFPDFREFCKDFEEKFERAKPYAFTGDARRTILALSAYMEIPYRLDRIASLLKIAYLQEIEQRAQDEQINWILTLRRYIDRYGKDAELEFLLREKGLYSYLENIEDEGEKEGYRRHKFIEEIVIYFTHEERA